MLEPSASDYCPSFRTSPPVRSRGRFFMVVCGGANPVAQGMFDYSDKHLAQVLRSTKSIAMVGVSTNRVRPSYFAARYLALKGFTVIPVNPVYAGEELVGRKILSDLSEIDEPVDMVDIFRRSDQVPEIVAQAMAHLSGLKTIWMQIGVRHAETAAKAEAQGLTVIQNRCPKIEYQRLFGELRMAGFATRIISSRL